MNKFSKGDLYFIVIQILNTFLLILGIGLFASSIYLSTETDSINTFTVSLGFLSVIIIFTSCYGYFGIKNAPCSILIYNFFILMMTLTIIPLGFYIMFDQEVIVNFLIEKMHDSEESINKAKKAIDMNMDITKITLLIYSIILISCFFLAHYYRKHVLKKVKYYKAAAHGDDVLLQVRKNKDKLMNE